MSKTKTKTGVPKMLRLVLTDENGNVLDSWESKDERNSIVFEAVAQAVGWWAPIAQTITAELERCFDAYGNRLEVK